MANWRDQALGEGCPVLHVAGPSVSALAARVAPHTPSSGLGDLGPTRREHRIGSAVSGTCAPRTQSRMCAESGTRELAKGRGRR